VLSAGSLYTSTIPALLGRGVAEALAAFTGPVLYVANAMTQPEETAEFTVSDHVRAITDHVGPVISDVLVNSATPAGVTAARYREHGARPVPVDQARRERLAVRVHTAPLLRAPRAGAAPRLRPPRRDGLPDRPLERRER
jgi:uncharacterized cofD-like protein